MKLHNIITLSFVGVILASLSLAVTPIDRSPVGKMSASRPVILEQR